MKHVKNKAWWKSYSRIEQVEGMYEDSHPDHMKLRRLDQSLNGDWREQIGLPFKVSCGWVMQFVGGYFTRQHTVWKYVIKIKPYAKIAGGRIRPKTADGLGHSLQAQNKPEAA